SNGAASTADVILADHADFITGKWLKATAGASGIGGLKGISDGVAAPTAGLWHEAPALNGNALAQAWVMDFSSIGNGAADGRGGSGGVSGPTIATAGANGSNGWIVIWY